MKNERPGLPIFLENTPSAICEQVLWLIKNSGINFQVKETPFSLDINIKKRFANLWNQSNRNPVSHQSASQLFSQLHETPDHTQDSDLLCQIDSLKGELEDALHQKNEASKGLLELDQAHRKLSKENKELLKRHEHVCSELKALKDEKESIAKERNSLSVALQSSNKDLEHSIEGFEKEAKFNKIELEKLTKFKAERDAELKAIKKVREKKQTTNEKRS